MKKFNLELPRTGAPAWFGLSMAAGSQLPRVARLRKPAPRPDAAGRSDLAKWPGSRSRQSASPIQTSLRGRPKLKHRPSTWPSCMKTRQGLRAEGLQRSLPRHWPQVGPNLQMALWLSLAKVKRRKLALREASPNFQHLKRHYKAHRGKDVSSHQNREGSRNYPDFWSW